MPFLLVEQWNPLAKGFLWATQFSTPVPLSCISIDFLGTAHPDLSVVKQIYFVYSRVTLAFIHAIFPTMFIPHYPGVCIEDLCRGLKNIVPSRSLYYWRWWRLPSIPPPRQRQADLSVVGASLEYQVKPAPQRVLIKHPRDECVLAFTSSLYYSIVLVILLQRLQPNIPVSCRRQFSEETG